MISPLDATRLFALVLVAATATGPAIARGQLAKDDLPAAAQGIDVEDRVGEFIPLNLLFNDERGNPVALQRYFKQGKPIVLTMNYSDCPGLCMAQLENLVDTLRQLDGGGIGEKFEMISVSIDPTESATKAALTKKKYVGLLRETGAEKGWHFLTGQQSSITELAKSLGFHYSYDKASKRYSHASVTYFISPDGRICRYFLSLREEPEQFKFALNEASQGRLGISISDTLVQMCYSYDPDANRYTADARRLLSFAAGIFALILLGFVAPFWFSPKAAQPATGALSPPLTSPSAGNPSAGIGPTPVRDTQSNNDTQLSARQE